MTQRLSARGLTILRSYSVLRSKVRHRVGLWIGRLAARFPLTVDYLRSKGFPVSAYMPLHIVGLERAYNFVAHSEARDTLHKASPAIFEEHLWHTEDHIGMGKLRIPLIRAIKPEDQTPTRLISEIMPGDRYNFSSEEAYLQNYRTAGYAWSPKKGGWDSMRLIEIASNGCFPIVPRIDKLPAGSLAGWPIPLLNSVSLKANRGELSMPSNSERRRLAELVVANFSAENQAKSILRLMRISKDARVLFLKLGPINEADYVADGFLVGFSRALQGNLSHFGPVPFYLGGEQKSNSFVHGLYGGGFGYSGELEHELETLPFYGGHISLSDVVMELRDKSEPFDLVVVSRAESLFQLAADKEGVLEELSGLTKLVFLDGGDLPSPTQFVCAVSRFGTYLSRES